MKEWEIIEPDLLKLWNKFNIEYVSPYADEPLCGLCLQELNTILENTNFSKDNKYNNVIKLVIKLHCMGISDSQISFGLKMLGHDISINHITQIRFLAMKKIEEKYKENIGLITVLYEAFHGLNS